MPYRRTSLVAVLAAGCTTLALTLAGCSPRYDWREVRDDSDVCLFPDKPESGKRDLALLGARVTLQLRSAKVGSTTFGIGSAVLPAVLNADEKVRASVVQAFETALLRNIGNATVQQASVAPVRAWDAAHLGRPALAREIDAVSTVGEPMRVMARFYVVDGRFVEIIVIGRQAQWPQQEVETFLENYRPA
jgi:hypothetical protein